jgi:FkbM family methyltransferase
MGKKRYNQWILLTEEKGSSFVRYVQGISPNGYDMGMFYGYQDAFDDALTDKRVAIDVGASYGFVTKFLSERFDRVISSEVVPSVRHCLKENVKNQNMSNVEILEFGFSNQNGTLDIYFNERYSGHSSFIQNEAAGNITTSCVVRTIDSCDYDVVDYIKIDVEGHELEVLQGAINTLQKCKPMVSIEVSLNDPTRLKMAFEACMLLENLGYTYHSTATNDFIYIFKGED